MGKLDKSSMRVLRMEREDFLLRVIVLVLCLFCAVTGFYYGTKNGMEIATNAALEFLEYK